MQQKVLGFRPKAFNKRLGALGAAEGAHDAGRKQVGRPDNGVVVSDELGMDERDRTYLLLPLACF